MDKLSTGDVGHMDLSLTSTNIVYIYTEHVNSNLQINKSIHFSLTAPIISRETKAEQGSSFRLEIFSNTIHLIYISESCQ